MVRRPLVLQGLIALALAAITVAMLTATSPQIGLTWDEPAYIAASESYVQWLDRLVNAPRYALEPGAVQTFWELNHEHPPLDKLWSGVVWAATRGLTDDLTAHRLGNILLVGALVAALFLSVARGFGNWAGLAAAAALLSMPRFFFHAHLAALDVPAAAAVFLVTALFWHTRERRSLWWDILFGLAWGAALAVKVNALLVLPTLLLWLLLFRRSPRLLLRVLIALPLGFAVFVALWPWLYHESWDRLVAYARFLTVDHWEIGQWYRGRWRMPPPWHFAPVMLVAATPTALLALAAIGGLRGLYEVWGADLEHWVRHRRQKASERPPMIDIRYPPYDDGLADDPQARAAIADLWSVVLLWALSAAASLGALMIGQTKVYDNERLFMPVFPFVAALAGVGLVPLVRSGLDLWSTHRLPQRFGRLIAVLSVALVPAVYVPQVATGAALYPHLLSYYSDAIGGLPGAVRRGLETTYWCETYAEVLPYINERAPQGATVWAEPWSHDVLLYYQLTGRLRADLRVLIQPGAGTVLAARGAEGQEGTIGGGDYVIVAYRETGLAVHPDIKTWMAGRTPLVRVLRFGVPLVDLYEGR